MPEGRETCIFAALKHDAALRQQNNYEIIHLSARQVNTLACDQRNDTAPIKDSVER
jgi:hypothetical protein